MSYTVLLCDDAVFMRSMLSNLVVESGYEVVGEAATGTEAVEQYKRLKPDVVLLDIVMPDKSGLVALREIRELDPQARVIMCSSMGQQIFVNEALADGAKGFIVKPFTGFNVLDALKAAVN